MFTGIINHLGIIKQINKKENDYYLDIEIKDIKRVKLGDSIAVNGVCLTVIKIKSKVLSFQVMQETINRTNFKYLKQNDLVNIEQAATLNTRLSGHLVSGHIDLTGTVILIKPDGDSTIYQIKSNPELIQYLITKGSIAIDGISLTIVLVDKINSLFSVNIISHTYNNTNIKNWKINQTVNLEIDMIAKLVKNFIS